MEVLTHLSRLMPAQRAHIEVGRAMSRVFHMLDTPDKAFRKPKVMLRILQTWIMPKSKKKARNLYPERTGPTRAEMFAKLKIAA